MCSLIKEIIIIHSSGEKPAKNNNHNKINNIIV